MAAQVGADDIQPTTDEEGNPSSTFHIFSTMEDFGPALAKLGASGLALDRDESSLVYRAAVPVEVEDEAFDKCEALMEKLLELDDVDAVYTNCEGLTA